MIRSKSGPKPQMTTATPTKWIPTKDLLEALGMSDRTLRRRIADQTFKLGEHYIDKSPPGAGRPNYGWSLQAIQALFSVPPEIRL